MREGRLCCCGLVSLPLLRQVLLNGSGTGEITVEKKLGHDFDANGVCQRCSRQAEAKLSNSGTYYATAAEAIDAAAGTGEAVIIVSYAADKQTPSSSTRS